MAPAGQFSGSGGCGLEADLIPAPSPSKIAIRRTEAASPSIFQTLHRPQRTVLDEKKVRERETNAR